MECIDEMWVDVFTPHKQILIFFLLDCKANIFNNGEINVKWVYEQRGGSVFGDID